MPEQLATSFLLTKLITGLSGLFGGICIGVFWQPKKIRQKGLVVAGAIIGAISFGIAFVFGGVAASVAGVDLADPDNAMAIGVGIGALAVGVISYLATWLEKREGKDIGEVIREVKAEAKELL